MRYDEVIQKVQDQGRITDRQKAEKVIAAVFGTLGELVYRTEQRQLVAQLPKELKKAFEQYQGPERGRGDLGNYPAEEFYNRVKARADVTLQESRRLSGVVLSVLQEAVTPGQMEDVRRELADRFQKLLNKGSEQESPAAETPARPSPASIEYHITPGNDGNWQLQRGENGEVMGSFANKEAAIAKGDDIADRDRGDVLVIHNIDGSISKKEAPSRETAGVD